MELDSECLLLRYQCCYKTRINVTQSKTFTVYLYGIYIYEFAGGIFTSFHSP